VNIPESIKYWLASSEDDWKVAEHLFEKGDNPYALFFGHLTIEKILKALYVKHQRKIPPHTHRLVYLSEKIPLTMKEEQIDFLEIITDYNLEARYPDEKFSFREKCTQEYTKKALHEIKEFREWLLQQVKSEKSS